MKCFIKTIDWGMVPMFVFLVSFVIVSATVIFGEEALAEEIPALVDLEVKIQECVELVEVLSIDEESPTISASFHYMLSLLDLVDGQLDTIKAVREYGEPEVAE